VSVELVLQYAVAGLTYGAIYAVVGIGFNITYNATGIINFAQGEFVMLGAMIAASLHAVLPLPAAIAVAVLATMAVGALVELTFIRWLWRPSVLRMIVITIGVSILLREAALLVWGTQVRSLPYFTGDEVTALQVAGARVSPQVLWTLGTCSVVVALLAAFFRSTPLGRQMRACASNREAAVLCGIRARNLVTLAFVLSAGIGAIAGCVVAPITSTHPGAGTALSVKGFTVAVLGGLGSSFAPVGAGILLGLVEAFSIALLPAAFKDAVSVAVLLAVLFLRPSGLFGDDSAARVAHSGPGVNG
jgi:branched-chain amino acid transport system permease protein